MNALERQMVELLHELRERHHAIGVKAELELEATRPDELLRLKDVTARAGLGITLKIGGAEAITDLYLARLVGVERVVAPMVESAFAVSKALGAVRIAYAPDERQDLRVAINVETVSACRAFDEILALPDADELDGVVVGRVDLAFSMGLAREHIQGDRVRDMTVEVLRKAKGRPGRPLAAGIGGGVDAGNLAFYRSLPEGLLDYFETRKVIFACPAALGGGEAAMQRAVEFELLWLRNKQRYYAAIAAEDEERIAMLEARLGDR